MASGVARAGVALEPPDGRAEGSVLVSARAVLLVCPREMMTSRTNGGKSMAAKAKGTKKKAAKKTKKKAAKKAAGKAKMRKAMSGHY